MLTHDMAVYMVLLSIFVAVVWLICLTYIVLQDTKRIDQLVIKNDKKELEPKKVMVMCPTLRYATQEWERLRKLSGLWIESTRHPLTITSYTGTKYYFVSETEGSRRSRGFHGEIVSIDEFEWLEKLNYLPLK